MLRFFLSRRYFVPFALALLLFELVLNVAIIWRVEYTNIDWEAYVQEVQGWLAPTGNDYSTIEGNTGPLVYPWGFLWIYGALYRITGLGLNIRLAQYLFAGLHVASLGFVFDVMHQSKAIPPWVMLLISLSRRIHSIYVLRLFNDCFAMAFLWASLSLLSRKRWLLGCVLFSLAVSIKMNVLLFAPALGLLMLQGIGPLHTAANVFVCALIQIVPAIPFLKTNWVGYVGRSFNLGRMFFYKWTVNWKFVPEALFLNPKLAALLLMLHLVVLSAFVFKKWWKPCRQTPDRIISLMLVSNFIGIVFARSLHYQFFVWYRHSVPFLLWKTRLPVWFRVIFVIALEVPWNVYPATWWSSLLLQGLHLLLLWALWKAPEEVEEEKKKV